MGELLVLRLVHVLGGTFWVGTALFNLFFLMPAIAPLGPTAGQVMAGLQRRRMMLVLPLVAIATILSGARLMWLGSGGLGARYLETRTGLTLTIAAAAATLSWLLGVAFIRPAMSRAASLGPAIASAPEGERARLAAELEGIRRRAGVMNSIAVTLLVIAAAGMAVARYVR